MADLFTPMAPRVAATLRLADHVAAGAASVPALAERTGSDPDALGRLVDDLVTMGCSSAAARTSYRSPTSETSCATGIRVTATEA